MEFSDEGRRWFELQMSRHASERAQQRGFKPSDLELILGNGTTYSEATVLTRKDAEQAIRQRKREIQDLERLKGAAVIHQAGVVATMYRPGKRRLRKLRGR